MPRGNPRSVMGYGVAALAVGLALAVKLLIAREWAVEAPFLLFLGAVLFSSWFGGVGPGLTATLLAALAADYFFLGPDRRLGWEGPNQGFRLAQFLIEGVFISVLSGLRRRSAEQARQRAEELRVTLRSIGDAVVAADRDGRVTFLNPGAEGLTGWTQAEAAGRPSTAVLHLVHEQTGRRVGEDPCERVLRTGRATRLGSQAVLVARDGTARPVDDTAAPIRDPDGRLTGVVVVFRDVTDRRDAEERRRRLVTQLGAEQERRRLSRELHDETSQQMAALIMGLRSLRDRSAPGCPAAAALEGLQDQAEQVGEVLHRIAYELRPAVLDELGLETALRDAVGRWSRRAGIPAEFYSTLGPARLPADVETHVYRMVNEALTNVLKHAGANRISVVVERPGDGLAVIVEDDGRGFDPDAAARDANGSRLGLRGMRERAALLGGTVEVESAAGDGTTVFIRVPRVRPVEERP